VLSGSHRNLWASSPVDVTRRLHSLTPRATLASVRIPPFLPLAAQRAPRAGGRVLALGAVVVTSVSLWRAVSKPPTSYPSIRLTGWCIRTAKCSLPAWDNDFDFVRRGRVRIWFWVLVVGRVIRLCQRSTHF
jgi:hypothetical protein